MIAAVLANINRGKDQQPFEIQDFMPQTKKTREERERDEARRNARAILEALKNG